MFLHVATALGHLRFLKSDNVLLLFFLMRPWNFGRAAAYRDNDGMIQQFIVLPKS